MQGALAGRTVIVTGSAQGLGRGIALECAKAGARLGLIDIDGRALATVREDIVAAGGMARAESCDVADQKQFHAACQSIADVEGPIDVLVNNAMWTRYEPLESITDETLGRTLSIGVKPVIWSAQALCKIGRSTGGALVNLTSATAVLGFRNAASYTAAKGAISALTRQLAIELSARHIRVNAVMPGPIPTENARTVVNEDGWRSRAARTPLGHLGEPSDIGQAVVFLASDAGRFVTGQILTVDGGFTIAGP